MLINDGEKYVFEYENNLIPIAETLEELQKLISCLFTCYLYAVREHEHKYVVYLYNFASDFVLGVGRTEVQAMHRANKFRRKLMDAFEEYYALQWW